MGSIDNPNIWSPYNSFPDCSQGICTAYCPQWCYIIFPSPPPPSDGAPNFSPLVIVLIGILTGAFLLVGYYTVISKYCKGRRIRSVSSSNQNDPDSISSAVEQVSPSGIDDAVIRSITVYKYVKGDGIVDGTECSVCLSEFEEKQSLRILPKCRHAFHLHCIDTWLKSHSNCPLCRSNVVSGTNPIRQSDQNTRDSSNLNVSSLQVLPTRDLVLVVDERESVMDYRGENGIRSSVSMMGESFSSCQWPAGQLLIADILFMNVEEMGMEIQEEERETMEEQRNSTRMMRDRHGDSLFSKF